MAVSCLLLLQLFTHATQRRLYFVSCSVGGILAEVLKVEAVSLWVGSLLPPARWLLALGLTVIGVYRSVAVVTLR